MTSRERRTILLGSAIVVATLLLTRVLPAVSKSYVHTTARLAADEERLVRLRAEVEDVDALGDLAERVREGFIALAPAILTGSSRAEAVASLTGHLNAAADRSRSRLEAIESLPDSTIAGALRRVTVRASFKSDLQGVASFLRSLDLSPVAIAIASVRITAADPASAESNPEILRSEIRVTGWYLVKEEQ